MSNNNSSSGGIGIGGVLVCIFITLKLCHVINWSWWWILSPLWIGVAIMITIFATVMIAYIAAQVARKNKRLK